MIVCIDIDPKHYSELATASHAQAAHKWGASHVTIRDHSAWNDSVVWEKFRIYEYLKAGYRVLLIDNDAIITSHCPNLFKNFPAGHMYALDEFDVNKFHGTKKEIINSVEVTARILCHKGKLNLKGSYFNMGVVLLDPKHAWMFERGPWMKALRNCWLPEQDYWNYLICKFRSKVNIHSAPLELNWCNPPPGSSPWIVHAMGAPHEEKYQMLSLWT